MSIFGLFGVKSSVAEADKVVVQSTPYFKIFEDMNDLEKYHHLLGNVELAVSSYRRVTHSASLLDAETRQIVKNATKTDIIGFILEELANLSLLKNSFAELERLVKSGQPANLRKFDGDIEKVSNQVANHFNIAQLISTKVLNTQAKNSLLMANQLHKDSYNYSINLLTTYVQLAEIANKFIKDIKLSRGSAKGNVMSRSNAPSLN